MSLVLGYCNGTSGIIASDGRAGGTVCPSEEYDKTRKINNNIILGFVGYKESSEHFLNCVHMELGERIKDCYINEFLEVVKYGMNLDVTKEHLHASFLIIGKSDTGNMKFVLAGQDTNYSLKYLDANIGRIYPIGGTVPIKSILDICEYHSKLFDGNVKGTLKNIITDASKIDNSINENVYFQEIPHAPIFRII